MSSFQQKLYDHEVPPPPSAWSRINDALNDGRSLYEFPEKLYNTEVRPPAAVWNRIATSLSAETQKNSKPRVIPMFFRYAVAAAILAAVAVTAFLYNRKPEARDRITSGENLPVQLTPAPALPQAPAVAGNDPALTQNPEPATGNTFSKQTATAAYATRAVKRGSVVQPDNYEDPLYAYEDDVQRIADRYIMLMTPDGNFIRMSKKLGGLVCCVTGQEQDEQCRTQIKKWQQEIASSPVAGPANVLDLLDLVNSLNNGTQL